MSEAAAKSGPSKATSEGESDVEEVEVLEEEEHSLRIPRKSEPNFLPFMSPRDCVQLLVHFRGPEVTIFIGEKEKLYHLSKNLVCHYSSYFDAVFNGSFKESKTRELHLNTCTEEIFDMIIAWMWTGRINIPTVTEENGKQTLTDILDFMLMADYLNLEDASHALDSDVQHALSLFRLLSPRSCLTAAHIRTSQLLPAGHSVRDLFVQACFPAYKMSLKPTTRGYTRKLFKFADEVNELDGFASDLARALARDARTVHTRR